MNKLILICTIGSLIGYLVEAVHHEAGVWLLPQGQSLPLWIVAVYFAALLGIGFLLHHFEKFYIGQIKVSRTAIVTESLIFGLLILLPPLRHQHELQLFYFTTAYLIIRLLFFGAAGDGIVVFTVIVLDLIVELALVSISAYGYAHAAWWPLPLWLGPLWGSLGFGLRRLFLFFNPPVLTGTSSKQFESKFSLSNQGDQ